MKELDLVKKLDGVHTIESIMDTLEVNRRKAIYAVSKLRKKGYVKTKRLSDKKRVYNISFNNRLKGYNYIDIINKKSPIKIVTTETYKIYGKEPTFEETLIYAIKTKSLRTILAALSLFKEIDDWGSLYQLAKANYIERQVGALYDLSRKVMKIRRMTKRFRNNSLPKEEYSFAYVIQPLKSKDFNDIEKIWKVFLPFNKKDLEDYNDSKY